MSGNNRRINRFAEKFSFDDLHLERVSFYVGLVHAVSFG
jgi:hypothetical protein